MASLRLRIAVSLLFGVTCPAALVIACGGNSSVVSDSGTMPPGTDSSTIDRARLDAPIRIIADAGPDADEASACSIVIDTPELLPGTHVPEGTPITWSSNPPSSGPHYPVWANFQEFPQAVDLGYIVHSIEHGALVMFHQCASGTPECDAIVAGFRQVRDAIPTDPKCDPAIRVRVIIVADPLLDVPVAAAAWGWTYKAGCLDIPTLTDFAKAHIAQGTEDLCAAGKTTF
jgi:hypothetical protein